MLATAATVFRGIGWAWRWTGGARSWRGWTSPSRWGAKVARPELDEAIAQGVRVLLATGAAAVPHDVAACTPDARVLEAANLVALASSGALDQLPEGRAVVFDPIGGPRGGR